MQQRPFHRRRLQRRRLQCRRPPHQRPSCQRRSSLQTKMVEVPDASLASMSRVQLVGTMQEVNEQHAKLLEMTQGLVALEARIVERL